MGLLADTAAAIAAGEQTSRRAVERALDAADRLQPVLNAFTMLFHDEAMEAARLADEQIRSRGPRGSLHGVPVAVKDLYDVAGAVTSGCSRAYLSVPPATRDAAAVAALRDAGAVLIGKTNMHELAFGASTTISCFGPANNPWDPERMPGGSSGGSAAVVAARIVGAALGSDTGGSIRIPSAFCGTTGLKVTAGLLPLDGVLPMSPSLDTPGGIATDAIDMAIVHGVLSGEPASLHLHRPVDGLRTIGIPTEGFFEGVDPEIVAAVRAAAEAFAADGVEIREVSAAWAVDAREAWLIPALAEFARAHAPLLERLDDLDPHIQMIIQAGAGITADDERAARDRATAARNAYAATMAGVQILVTPTTPYAAARHDDTTISFGGVEWNVALGEQSHNTRPFSTLGVPAISLPCGATSTGLPIGVQLSGRPGAEQLLLNAAARYQSETAWHRRVPPNAA